MNSYNEIIKNTLFPSSGYNWNRFTETGLLGKGGFGRVMSAVYKNDNKSSFAIKYFTIYKQSNKSRSDEEQITIEDVENEIECLEILLKLPVLPNTLPIYYGYICLADPIQTEFRLYFKNEGYPIKQYFQKDSPKWKTLKHITDQLIMTFAFLQSNGLAHRDLKPANILIKDESDELPLITVIDFGIATKIQDSLTTKPILKNMGGTEIFMSPERRNNSEENEQKLNPYKSDTFSLGLVLLNLILGEVFKVNLMEKSVKTTLRKLLERLLNQHSNNALEAEEIKWYYKNIFKKMLIFEFSDRPDFIELYYIICIRNRKNAAIHILCDFERCFSIQDRVNDKNLLLKMIESKYSLSYLSDIEKRIQNLFDLQSQPSEFMKTIDLNENVSFVNLIAKANDLRAKIIKLNYVFIKNLKNLSKKRYLEFFTCIKKILKNEKFSNNNEIKELYIKLCLIGVSDKLKIINNFYDFNVDGVGCDFVIIRKFAADWIYHFQIWDLASQERYLHFSKLYLRGSIKNISFEIINN